MVLGSRGGGRLRRVMPGTVAEGLLFGAECPVLVVPRPHGAPRQPEEQRAPALAAHPQPFI
jgi:hypothetical protein